MRNFILGIVFVYVCSWMMDFLKAYRYHHFDRGVIVLSRINN